MGVKFFDYVLDNGLAALVADCDAIYICSTQPNTYAEATATYDLGRKLGITLDAITANAPNGRKTRIPAITDGEITDSGTAAFFALVDTTASRILVVGDLDTPQVVTAGNAFSNPATDVFILAIPD